MKKAANILGVTLQGLALAFLILPLCSCSYKPFPSYYGPYYDEYGIAHFYDGDGRPICFNTYGRPYYCDTYEGYKHHKHTPPPPCKHPECQPKPGHHSVHVSKPVYSPEPTPPPTPPKPIPAAPKPMRPTPPKDHQEKPTAGQIVKPEEKDSVGKNQQNSKPSFITGIPKKYGQSSSGEGSSPSNKPSFTQSSGQPSSAVEASPSSKPVFTTPSSQTKSQTILLPKREK